jgi:hypothetical protein
MREWFRMLSAAMSLVVLLVGTVWNVSAGPPPWQAADAAASASQPGAGLRALPIDEKACTKMEAKGRVQWYSVDTESTVDAQALVEEYPYPAVGIAPGFEYSCVPRNTTILSVFSHTDDISDVLDYHEYATTRIRLLASNQGGTFFETLMAEKPCDECDAQRTLPIGRYLAEFYLNGELLASGETTVGAEQISGGTDDADWVTVQGKVRDDKTRKPIKGAIVGILEPGVNLDDWIAQDTPVESIYTTGVADRKGEFVLDDALEREVTYTIITVADGYRSAAWDEFIIKPGDPDPFEITVDLERIE